MWAEELTRNRSNRSSFRYHIFPEINTSKNRLKLLQYLKTNNHHILNFQAQKTRILIKAGYWRSAAAVCLARQLAQVFVFRLTAPKRAQLPVYTIDSLLSRFLKKLFEPLPEECRCFWLGTVIFQLWILKPWLPFKDFRSRLNSLTIWKEVYYLENLFNFIPLKYRFLIFFVHKNINIFTLLEQFVHILEYLHKFSKKTLLFTFSIHY